ncbi:MAG: formylglycine-generating enzyme family protein [Pseudomonadota bacterium]
MNAPLDAGKSAVSRADLLRALAVHGEQALCEMAFAFGYEAKPQPENKVVAVDAILIKSGPPPAAKLEVPTTTPAARFFYVTSRERRDTVEEISSLEAPKWLKKARVLTRDERPDPRTVRIPPRLPLTRWTRLWPFLHLTLGRSGLSRRPDIPRIIRRLTQGEVLRRLPFHSQHQWSPRICILLDYNRRTLPFREDFNAFCESLESLHGAVGLDVRILHGEPGRRLHFRQASADRVRRWHMPDVRTPLLILSDLGMLETSPETIHGWRQFGYRLRAAGCKPVVLCPVSERRFDAVLKGLFSIYEWDRQSPLLRSSTLRQGREETAAESAELLLTLLAPAIVIESALLRAVRYLLPGKRADVAAEALAWSHPDVSATTQGFCFGSLAAIENYQRKFTALAPELQSRAIALIRSHHVQLPVSIRLAELDDCERLAPGCLDKPDRREVQRWRRDIVKTFAVHADLPALRDWQGRHLAGKSEMMWRNNGELAALWALAQRVKLDKGEAVELPPHVKDEDVRFFLDIGRFSQPRSCTLRQRGEQLVLEEGDMTDSNAGSPYARLSLAEDGLFVQKTLADDPSSALMRYVPAMRLPLVVVELTQNTRQIHLKTDSESLVVESLSKPNWAIGMGRDQRGLFAEVLWVGKRYRLDWQPPGPAASADDRTTRTIGLRRGFWRGEGPIGHDEYGPYADLTVKDVTQRFRWIQPGTFGMGSPESEPEREDDETPHPVTLTQGFWLADSACTQALWQAVMGDNPSQFRDDENNPVETVSWDDVHVFIEALNQSISELAARLPSEAEWEYACRAGSTAPFSFGGQITPEQVNYNGNNPYAEGQKGVYRKKTVPVRSLPANPWGLCEMHGNVWEWCEDWFGDYGAEAQIDPKGPPESTVPVLRGGSWIVVGRHVRSAYRSRSKTRRRSFDTGFRLALGQMATGRPVGEGQPGPGRTAASERGGQDGRSSPIRHKD